MNSARPTLSLQELEAFDPQAPAGSRRRFCCPLCGADKSRDGAHRCLSVETTTGLWKCFRCEAAGQLREQWKDQPLRRLARSKRALRSAFALEGAGQGTPTFPSGFPLLHGEPRSLPPEAIDDPLRRALRGLRPLAATPGENYLRKRGLSLTVCEQAHVKFCPSWLGRPAVVFPIYGQQGQLVAAQGRYTDGREDPKARTLGPKKSGVFLSGGAWQQVKRGAPLTITEAPIDALSLAMCGFPALALCGKSGWPSWLPIKCAFKEVAVAFDADEAGEGGVVQLRPVLESLGARLWRLLPEGEGVKDWNEMLQAMGAKELADWLCLRLLGGAENGSV